MQFTLRMCMKVWDMTYTKVIIAYMLSYLYNYPLEYESTNFLLRCNAYAFNRILWLAEDKVMRLSEVEADIETSFGGKEIRRLSVLEKIDPTSK